jgi:hypothetical protein
VAVPLARTATFRSRRERVMALFAKGRYEPALAEARTLRVCCPRRGEIPFWMACALCRLSRGDEALTMLREATEDGLWWPEKWLRDDDDLAAPAGGARVGRPGA